MVWLLGAFPTFGPRLEVSRRLPPSDICNADSMALSEAVSEAADIRAGGVDLGDGYGFTLGAVTSAGARPEGWGRCGERGRRGEGA